MLNHQPVKPHSLSPNHAETLAPTRGPLLMNCPTCHRVNWSASVHLCNHGVLPPSPDAPKEKEVVPTPEDKPKKTRRGGLGGDSYGGVK